MDPTPSLKTTVGRVKSQVTIIGLACRLLFRDEEIFYRDSTGVQYNGGADD
jgi:hypothetical protein